MISKKYLKKNNKLSRFIQSGCFFHHHCDVDNILLKSARGYDKIVLTDQYQSH